MEWYEIDVDGENSVKFNEKSLPWTNRILNYVGENKLGGIIKNGEWAYLANNRKIKIVSLRSGQTISSYEFLEENGFGHYYIRHICEIFYKKFGTVLAVCLQNMRNLRESIVAIYSVVRNSVFKSIGLELDISSLHYISPLCLNNSLLQRFDGCLAIGASSGALVLIDLNLCKILSSIQLQCKEHNLQEDCRFIDYARPFEESLRHFDECRAEEIHFGIQMEVLESSSSVTSILPIDVIKSLAVGYADGKLVIYDLNDLQIFHVAIPHPMQNKSPLVKMDYLEPPDDPRSCLYIWTMHESSHNLTAALHTLMYQTRLTDEDGHYFKDFVNGSIGLHLPLEPTKSHALSCQSIHKLNDENDSFCLSILTWYSDIEEKSKLVVFDLNQWYKEEMPITVNQRNYQSYLAGFILSGLDRSLYSHVNPNSIAHFNSMQRSEEHFFPNSLSFDCVLLLPKSCRNYRWEGIQNKVINLLRCSNSSIFLEQDLYYKEILRTGLLPQFFELNSNSMDLRKEKYYAMLSVALENNCVNLLRDCVKSWSDGSFMGSLTEVTGLSVSLMTNWIMTRATNIKMRCNDLCKGLFGYGGYSLDFKEQKELGILSRQLKLLADLLYSIISLSKRKLFLKDLEEKQTHLRAAAEYHEVLLWLFNIGLLPEAAPFSTKLSASVQFVSYPYSTLKDIYSRKRIRFANINDSFVSKKTGSCRLLFIDAFIEHECKGNMLREYWLENSGNGLYPPTSIEYMLRLLLIPEISFDKKCVILLYFFLDLNITVDQKFKDVVANFIKFPSVFKLSATLIKTVETFWNLDHDQFLPAVNEFISPFNNSKDYPHWMVELLIEALLAQKTEYLALRVIGSYPTFVAPILRLKTYLFNDLLSEAFHFARSKNDDSLLELFFTSCLRSGKYSVIRDFALSEKEGQLIQDILKRNNTDCSESLNFVYLLQKSKYIDAFSYLDDLSKSKYSPTNLVASYFGTPNLVSAFNITMTPVTQGLTDIFFRIRNKIKKKETNNNSPVPLSCQLIKKNANDLLGGIYHSSALSAHFATCYFDEANLDIKHDPKTILSPNDAPFLRKPQSFNLLNLIPIESKTISYPQMYKQSCKRSLAESELQDTNEDYCTTVRSEHNPRKKRRLIGQELLHELSQFKEKALDASSQNEHTFTYDEVNSNSFFTNPISSVKQIKEGVVKSSERCDELHSILKTHVNPATNFRKEFSEEEKNIRFRLPSFEKNNYTHLKKSEDIEVAKFSNLADKVKCRKIEVTECIDFKSGNENKDEIDINSRCLAPLEENVSEKQILIEDNKKPSSNLSHQGETVMQGSKLEASTEDFFSQRSLQNTSFNLTKLDSSAIENENLTLISELGPKPRKHIIRSNMNSNVLLREKDYKQNEIQSEKEIIEKISTEKIQSLKKEAENSYLVSYNNNDGTDFIPKISSSKICETQFSQEQLQSKRNILECTTIVDSLAPIDSDIVICDTFEKTQELEKHNKSLNKLNKSDEVCKMLDTTLEMSAYDFTLIEPTNEVMKIPKINTGVQAEEEITDIDNNNMEALDHIDYNRYINIIEVENSSHAESKKNNSESCSTDQDTICSNVDIIELLSSNDNSCSSNNDFFQGTDSDKSNGSSNIIKITSEKSESNDAELYEDLNTISGSSETDEVEIIDVKCKATEIALEIENDSIGQSSMEHKANIDQFYDTFDQTELCKLDNVHNSLPVQNEHNMKLDDFNVDVVNVKNDGALNEFSKDDKKLNSDINLKNKYELKTATVSLPSITNIELNLDNPPLSGSNEIVLNQVVKQLEKEDSILNSKVNKNSKNFVLDAIDYANILDNNKYSNKKSIIDTVPSKGTNKTTNEKRSSLLLQQKEKCEEYSEQLRSTSEYNDKGLLLKENHSALLGRNKRGISVPPQHNFTENDETYYTTRTRKIRATSLQPESPNKFKRTRPRRHSRSTSVSVVRDTENRSPSLVRTENISLRRSSVVLESIVENNPLTDSPSANTRSRSRFSSIDSEPNISVSNIEQTPLKRRRGSSVVSQKSDHTPLTTKRSNRSSVSSQSETHTPKSVQQLISQRKIIYDTKQDSMQSNEKEKNVKNEDVDASLKKCANSVESINSMPNTEISPTTGDYTETRRLTRAQLSILEKSSVTSATAFSTKRVLKRASSHNSLSSNNSGSSNSISSYADNLSKKEVARRITRSSTKDKDEVDVEVVSNASSNSSRRQPKLRSKKKTSPKMELNTIPENEPERN